LATVVVVAATGRRVGAVSGCGVDGGAQLLLLPWLLLLL
jgi:hypothetical protein